MQRHRVTWTNLIGLPGVSTFYFVDSNATGTAALHAFFEAIKFIFPAGCVIHSEAQGDVVDPATGNVTGVWEQGQVDATLCTGQGNYAAPVGMQVNWKTAGVAGGRHIQGRTFLVPVISAGFEPNGTPGDNTRNQILSAATDLVLAQSSDLLIWHRPRAATPQWTDVRGKVHAARAQRAGSSALVTSAQVPDKAAILSSRRQ
jgi:hypothetical protein